MCINGLIRIIVVLTIMIVVNGCNKAGKDVSRTSGAELQISELPASGATLNAASVIQLHFSSSMNPASLKISGDLALQFESQWTDQTVANDTVDITPLSAWEDGNNRSIVIDVNTASGSTIKPVHFSYNVDTIAPTYIKTTAMILGKTQTLIFRFSELMDTDSLQLKGTMTEEISSAAWTASEDQKSILSIVPVAQWSVGSLTLAFTAKDLAGNLLTSDNMLWQIDDQIPTAEVSVANGASISGNTPITIKYSESILPESVVVSGSLFDQSGGAELSTTDISNDTITFTPHTKWAAGEQQLNLDATDIVGLAAQTVSIFISTDIVFVSNSGIDSQEGNRSNPMKTISAAMAKAQADQYGTIYLQFDESGYDEFVKIDQTIQLMGGFDANWNATENLSIISAPANRQNVLTIQSANDVKLSQLDIRTSNAEMNASALWIEDSSNVSIANTTITSGDGADGINGNDASDQTTSVPKSASGKDSRGGFVRCDDKTRAAGGVTTESGRRAGGNGGLGGKVDDLCSFSSYNPTVGLTGQDANISEPGLFGYGGNGGALCGGTALQGAPGTTVHGAGGTKSALDILLENNAGYVLTVNGGDGNDGNFGLDGTGGGGGGGSGGCDGVSNGILISAIGAGGGAGGTGGHRGNIGSGGHHGGYSIASVIINSEVSFEKTTLAPGKGGNGGMGGKSGRGELGGEGGNGGLGVTNITANAGKGGNGGDGGDGGAGAGGVGGPSYGIWLNDGSQIKLMGTTFVTTPASQGGDGGTGIAEVVGETGDPGASLEIKNMEGTVLITP